MSIINRKKPEAPGQIAEVGEEFSNDLVYLKGKTVEVPRQGVLELLPELPRFQDDKQKTSLMNILRFLAIMLAFTLIARGAAGTVLAKVKTTSPFSDEIVEEVFVDATVEAALSQPVTVPGGLPIEQIFVIPGQSIQAGEAIAKLDPAALAEQREKEQIKLDEMNLNLQKLEQGEVYDNTALVNAQNALAWAQQDYETARTAGETAVNAAQSDLLRAQQDYENIKATGEAAVNAAQVNLDAALEALRTAAPEDVSMAEANVAAAQAALDQAKNTSAGNLLAATQAVEAAETALEQAKNISEANLLATARTMETAEQNLQSAQIADQTGRQTAAYIAAQNELLAQALRLDIQKQQELIAGFDVFSAEGIILSPVNGIVLSVSEKGISKSEIPLAVISDASGGFRVRGIVSENDAKKLTNGMDATVTSFGGYYGDRETGEAVVFSIGQADADGYVEVVAKLSDGDWKHGQDVQFQITIRKEQYPICVPLSALHQSQYGYYVLVMEQRSGVLGTENVVRSIPVILLARDNKNAAVEGELSFEDQAISWASKPILNGDKVRVLQP